MRQRVEALSGLKVCAVAAGHGANCAVAAAGELFTWGSGWDWRLGHGDSADQLAPKRVEALQDEWVVAVSHADRHTVAATRGGVYGWGKAVGLGLQENTAVVQDGAGMRRIMSPYHCPQLSCVPRS